MTSCAPTPTPDHGLDSIAFGERQLQLPLFLLEEATPNRAPATPNCNVTTPSRPVRTVDNSPELVPPNIGHSSLTQVRLHPIAHRPRPPGTNAAPGRCTSLSEPLPCALTNQPHQPDPLPACLPYKYPANPFLSVAPSRQSSIPILLLFSPSLLTSAASPSYLIGPGLPDIKSLSQQQQAPTIQTRFVITQLPPIQDLC